MTAPVVMPEITPQATTGQPDLMHVVCCNPDLALCGEAVAGQPWGRGQTTCPLCAIAEAESLPCHACGGGRPVPPASTGCSTLPAGEATAQYQARWCTTCWPHDTTRQK